MEDLNKAVVAFSFYTLGFMSAMVIVAGYGLYRLRKFDNAKKKFLKDVESKALEAEAKMVSVKDRLLQVQDLTKQQLSLFAMADEPSKNSLHSKWKNGLNGEIKEIEDEKNKILQSILKDGFDPTITILNKDNQKEQLKLSQYLSERGLGVTAESAATPSTGEPDSSKPEDQIGKKVGRFVVYSGGNDDTTH